MQVLIPPCLGTVEFKISFLVGMRYYIFVLLVMVKKWYDDDRVQSKKTIVLAQKGFLILDITSLL